MKKNERIKIRITGTLSDGAGVGHHDGMAVFVRFAAVGDLVDVLIIKVTKSYAVGKLIEVVEPSADRTENDCPAYYKCGGCCYRHISYEAERAVKHQHISDCLKRIGGLDVEVEPINAGEPAGYRNKAQYPVGMGESGPLIGFYSPRSHRIADCRSCALQPTDFALAVEAFDRYIRRSGVTIYNEQTGHGLLRHIYLRKASVTGEIMACAVINGSNLPQSGMLLDELKSALGDSLKTVVLNINTADTNVILSTKCRAILGTGYITDVLRGIKVRLNPLSFYQVNHDMAERLYDKAAEFAGKGDTLIDLYCGAGTIGLSMSANFKKIIGVEVIPEAVNDAKFNAENNDITNAEFICADAYEAAKRLNSDGIKPNVVVVDPPRKGLEQGLPQHIAENMHPERIVYVSCDPATLARDLKAFAQFGYEVKRVVPFDLFPRTAHVETVALLNKKK